MINLAIILYSSFLVLVNSAPSTEKCSIEVCQPLINALDNYMVQYPSEKPSEDVAKNMTNLCQKISECLTPIKCDKGKEYREVKAEECLEFEIRMSDFEDCFPEVLDSVYDNEYDCAKKFDFLNRDLDKKRSAFTSGKSCFLEMAQKECETPAVGFLKKRYDDLVNVISIKPTRHNICTGPHYELNKLNCIPLQLDLKSKMDELKEKDIPVNDTRVTKVVKLCRETEKCINENCLFTETQRKDIKGGCDVLDLASSSFSECLKKIEIVQPKPDFKKYACLKGLDYHSEEKSSLCEKFQEKSDCMKTIMTDFCGKKMMDDYDKMSELLVTQLKC